MNPKWQIVFGVVNLLIPNNGQLLNLEQAYISKTADDIDLKDISPIPQGDRILNFNLEDRSKFVQANWR